MKLTTTRLKKIIKEELSSVLNENEMSPVNIFMDMTRQGSADYWLSQAYGHPMKAREKMHYEQAFRHYLDEVHPEWPELDLSVWKEVIGLLMQTK